MAGSVCTEMPQFSFPAHSFESRGAPRGDGSARPGVPFQLTSPCPSQPPSPGGGDGASSFPAPRAGQLRPAETAQMWARRRAGQARGSPQAGAGLGGQRSRLPGSAGAPSPRASAPSSARGHLQSDSVANSPAGACAVQMLPAGS